MTSGERRAWTRDELLLAINLYCKTPFGRIHVRNPDIIELAGLLERTPGSVSYKLANFASIDPSLKRKGASNVSKLDKQVWSEFFQDWDQLAYESKILAAELRKTTNEFSEDDVTLEGSTREATVKMRVNQRFFRKMILSAYDDHCCMTGMGIRELLVASHIVPWSVDAKNRMNPQNGLCLNALHDKAFDAGLISVDETFHVLISSEIRGLSPEESRLLRIGDGVEINLPKRFVPDQAFLEYHRENIFRP